MGGPFGHGLFWGRVGRVVDQRDAGLNKPLFVKRGWGDFGLV